jgi:Ca2+-binding RTX toxin-like protein
MNTLISIERIFSLRAGQDYTINQAIASTNGLPAFRLDNDNVINGTPGDDVIPAQTGVQGFYGGLGNDTYQGSNNFEQVNYDGARDEFTISRNANGSVSVNHPIWGNDTLIDIDGVVFTGVEPGVGGVRTAEFEYVSIADLVG